MFRATLALLLAAGAASGQDAGGDARILFVRDRAIWSVRPDGTGEEKLQEGGDPFFPVWSPDRRRILYHSDGSIRRMSARGGDDVELTKGLQSAWSPDGTEICFVRVVDRRPRLFIMKADGGSAEQVSRDDEWGQSPDWSPDGKRIALTGNREGEKVNSKIYVMDRDGSNVRRLVEAGRWEEGPAWSPDGTKIAYMNMTKDGWEVFVADAEGGKATNLTKNRKYDASPSWSPDGKRIAFVSDRDGQNDIHVMNADGTGVRRVTRGGGKDPCWSW